MNKQHKTNDAINESTSALFDNEDDSSLNLKNLIQDEEQQSLFSRYQLIGDVMRDNISESNVDIDVTQQVMEKIALQETTAPLLETKKEDKHVSKLDNVVIFIKRFSQYAIAASVAGVVVMGSMLTSQQVIEDTSLTPLNTVPFGGVNTPVSLKTQQVLPEKNSKAARYEHFEKLLQDHNLQLQIN